MTTDDNDDSHLDQLNDMHAVRQCDLVSDRQRLAVNPPTGQKLVEGGARGHLLPGLAPSFAMRSPVWRLDVRTGFGPFLLQGDSCHTDRILHRCPLVRSAAMAFPIFSPPLCLLSITAPSSPKILSASTTRAARMRMTRDEVYRQTETGPRTTQRTLTHPRTQRAI